MFISKVSKGSGLFIGRSLKNFKTIGSICPSSKYLTEKMLEPVKMFSRICIVELGAGTGAFTKKIISKLPPDGVLLVFEIDKRLSDFLKEKIKDSRVKIICDDAKNMSRHIKENGFEKADYVISGLPLGNMPIKKQTEILSEIRKILSASGLYVQFQYLLVSWLIIRKYFDVKIMAYEIRNLPPAFVYGCRVKSFRKV